MRILSTLLIVLVLFASVITGTSEAATAKAVSLPRLISNFDKLESDAVRGGRRDLWLSLEEQFAASVERNKGEAQARAALYHARCRQELGKRSYLPSDHREAVSRFASAATKYTKYSVAPESLYRQADVLANRLGEREAAIKVLEVLIKSYPKDKHIPQAQKLLAQSRNTLNASTVSKRNDVTTKKNHSDPSGSSADITDTINSSTVTLKKISWQGKKQRAIVTLELDASAKYAHNFLPPDPAKKTPGRLYLDIAGAFPSDALKPGFAPEGLVVSRIRTGLTGEGTRVTLECDDLQCYAVTTPKGSPLTIQVEVSRGEDIKGGITVAQKKKNAVKESRAESVMEQLGLTVQTIMLDAGHGGHDPGARAAGIIEKDFTLDMTKRLGNLLQKEGFTVLYTRTSNKYLSLQDRPDLANTKKVDLFISIHVNANTKTSIRGLETYYLDEAKSQDAATVAARENAVSVKNISDLQFILTDLMLSTKLKESHHLANCVHKGILRKLKSSKLEAADNGVRSAPFYVLMGARMPAILVEFGYITNKADAANMKSDTYLQRQAEGLVQGILQYKAELAKAVPGAGKS